MKSPISLRTMRSFGIAALAILAGLVSAAPARAAEKWLRLSSENFDMLSCTSERDSKQMLVQLEQFRMAFFRFFPQGRAYDLRPMIVVFDSDKQFRPYMPLFKTDGKERRVGGYFVRSETGASMVFPNNDLQISLQAIIHEYVHSLVSARGWRLPLWANEGFAEVFSSFTAKGDNVQLFNAQEVHSYVLQTTLMIPFSTLFAVDHKSSYYNERDMVGIFYAQSWALMHYVMCGTRTGALSPAALNHFLFLCEAGKSTVPEAFRDSFGMNMEDLDRIVGKYARDGGSYNAVALTVPAAPIRENITTRPATDLERDMELLELRWRIDRAPDAQALLFQMAENFPDNPRPHELLAEIAIRENEPRLAMDYWRKAIERKSQNPLVYVSLLQALFRESDTPFDYKMPAPMCAEYRALVDRALELAPDCMPAYELLATIESQSEKMRGSALNKVQQALPHMHEVRGTLMALAVVYRRVGDRKNAEAALNELLQNRKPSPELASTARELLRRLAGESTTQT